MKTLIVTDLSSLTAWLETDAGFATIYQSEPETVREVERLEPSKELFFSVAGERPTSLRKLLKVRRIAWARSPFPNPSDVAGAVLALAVFVYGLVVAGGV